MEEDTMDDAARSVTIAQFYVIMGVVSYLLTMGKSHSAARTYLSAFMVVLAGYETSVRFRWMAPLSLGFTITPHQQIMVRPPPLAPTGCRGVTPRPAQVFQKLFGPFMHGARIISELTFVDVDLEIRMRLYQLWQHQQELSRELRDIRARLPNAGRGAAVEDGTRPGAQALPSQATVGPAGRAASAKKRKKTDKVKTGARRSCRAWRAKGGDLTPDCWRRRGGRGWRCRCGRGAEPGRPLCDGAAEGDAGVDAHPRHAVGHRAQRLL